MLILPFHLADIEAKLFEFHLLAQWRQGRYATWMHHIRLPCQYLLHLCLGRRHALHHSDELCKPGICRFRWLLLTGRGVHFPNFSLPALLFSNRSQRSRLIRRGHFDSLIVTLCDADPAPAVFSRGFIISLLLLHSQDIQLLLG